MSVTLHPTVSAADIAIGQRNMAALVGKPAKRGPRQTIFAPHEVPPGCFTRTLPSGMVEVLYQPMSANHRAYHASIRPNLIMEGRRGTGKSHCIRWDFHLRALSYSGYTYLILRRTMPELRKSHLLFIGSEMDKLGGNYLKGVSEAHYPNGSVGLFGHCETEQDIEKYLSAQFAAIAFDEITTFDWDMVTRISSSCRVVEGSDLIAIVRGGTNPLGISAEETYRHFIARDIGPDEDPDYIADDWGSLHLTKEDNPALDFEQYDRRFSSLPDAYRKAWLDGEWGVEGAYFSLKPEHLIAELPLVSPGEDNHMSAQPMLTWPWLNIYRMLDFGWHDPTVVVYVGVLPNGREVAFAEQSWIRTPAQEVAAQMLRKSGDYRVVTTIADPTLWAGEKEMGHSIADEFENAGIPLTKAKNDRVAAGMSIQNHLNTLLDDGGPKLVIYEPGCPILVRALRAMRVDKKMPGRIADHKMDHMPICLGYFCMAGVGPTMPPKSHLVPKWMQHTSNRRVLGSEGVRKRR